MEKVDKNIDYYNDYSKSKLPSITKTVCAFLNTEGGCIILRLRKTGDKIVNAQKVVEQILVSLRKNIIIQHSNGNPIDSYIQINIDDKKLDGDALVYINISRIDEKSSYAYLPKKNDQEEYAFMRVGGVNLKTDILHLPYMRLVALDGFPLIKDYTPHLSIEREDFINNEVKNKVELKTIGELVVNKSNRIVKYMDLEAAMLSLINGNMRFYEPSNWEDEYECRFYNANYKKTGALVDKTKDPFLYATCMSSTRNNEAAWGIYSHKQTGLASRCVQFVLDLKELRKQLVANIKQSSIYFGPVNYKSKFYIDHLHESSINGSDNQYYHSFFDNFSLECYLNLLLLKRTDFEHEKEVRIFIIPNSKNKDSKKNKTRKTGKKSYEGNDKPQYIDVKIDWLEIIEEVRITAGCTFFEKDLLQKQLNRLLTNKKRKLKSPKNIASYEKKIQVQEFDPYKDDALKSSPLDIPVNNC